MEAVNPVSLNVVPVGVAICAKFAQPAPEQRSTLYPVTPTLSVEAVHDKLICVVEAAVAVKIRRRRRRSRIRSRRRRRTRPCSSIRCYFPPRRSPGRGRSTKSKPSIPVSLNVVPVGVAICAKFAQPEPEHRSTLYPVTPTLSVEAVHDKLICDVEAAVAVRFVGAVGGVVSAAAGVVAEKTFE